MSPSCANCDSWVSQDYARVFGDRDADEQPVSGCLECKPKGWTPR